MTGACACVAGFEGAAVIIHGPSGCYFYPATVLHRKLFCTFLIEEDIIHGTEERLTGLIRELSPEYQTIAVITTCVPSLIGEDLKGLVESRDIIFIDIPGFLGEFELGYHHALTKLPAREDPQAPGVNLDGLNLMDPFCRGNIIEGKRILDRMKISTNMVLCNDRVENLGRLSPYTIGTNPDLSSGRGRRLGSMLGLEGVRSLCGEIANHFPFAETGPVFDEADAAEDLIIRACDRYLKRYDPPSVLIFGVFAYAQCVADLLDRFLDADILLIGSRNGIAPSPFRTEQMTDLDHIAGLIREFEPDLVFGSSFEQSLRGNAGFVALTPPIRGTVRLRSQPLIGIEGSLSCMEETLNACMDQNRRKNC
jgi:nitrogenase molybdenum-iron protein alpha/beta subunit